MTEKLKPCPFCGNDKTAEIITEQEEFELLGIEDNFAEEAYAIACSTHKGGCGAYSGWHDTVEQAIEAWNRRSK